MNSMTNYFYYEHSVLFGQQVFGTVVGDQRSLKINILTKERNANLDSFICFYKNFGKTTKTVLTVVAE